MMVMALWQQLLRADRYLAQAQAVAEAGSGHMGDEWALAAAALQDARALLEPAGRPGCSPPSLRAVVPAGRSCTELIRKALTQLRWIPDGPHSPHCADAVRVALVALETIEHAPGGTRGTGHPVARLRSRAATPSAGNVPGRRMRDYLATACFPADRDDLLEHGVNHHAPPAMLQLLIGLPAHRTWPDPVSVLRALGIPENPPGGHR